MKTIILSAFGRFGDYAANSTEIVAEQLHERMIAGFKVHSIVFECSIPSDDRGRILLDLAETNKASGIIALGMASDKRGLCVESRARNVISNPKYCPDLEGKPVDPGFACEEELTLDLAPWNIGSFLLECGLQSVPVEKLSQDAGGFCCNHLMFQIEAFQRTREQHQRIPFVFVHIPCSTQAIVDSRAHNRSGKVLLSTHEVIKGLQILLEQSSL